MRKPSGYQWLMALLLLLLLVGICVVVWGICRGQVLPQLLRRPGRFVVAVGGLFIG